jgi:hypothetical protein
MKLSNAESPIPVPECVRDWPGYEWKCMFAHHLYQYMRAPIFVTQSLYDSWSLYNILGIRCVEKDSLSKCNPDELAYIESYHRNTSLVLFNITENNINGAWAPACINHCYISDRFNNPNYSIPQGSNYTLMQSIKYWIDGADESSRHIDFGEWPDSNKPCSGVSSSLRW